MPTNKQVIVWCGNYVIFGIVLGYKDPGQRHIYKQSCKCEGITKYLVFTYYACKRVAVVE